MQPARFTTANRDFLLDGQPFAIFSGEMHYFRVPREYWPHRLQAARAMGLNTISTYMPWNLHEPRPGEFDFADNLDVAEYIRQAQAAGLKVILRPGPYICSEWDFGGLPAWLLATPDIGVRCSDPRFLQAVERYFAQVGRQCATMQIHRGGPVILVQVENEYGAFGNDRAYMDRLVQLLRQAGFDAQLFTSDPPRPPNLHAGRATDAIAVGNFGTRAHQQIPVLGACRPDQPLMCGELWAGWFDAWGEPRAGSDDPAPVLAEVQWMLEHNTSFNFYMFHGGSSFGFMAGANHREHYCPTISSYDFRAPLDQAGRPTAKYFALRELLARHQPGGTPLPPVPPAPLPIIEISTFDLTETAPILANLHAGAAPVRVPLPKPMEMFGQSYGALLYRTSIAGLGDQELRIVEPHDFAIVFLNGQHVGSIDRRSGPTTLKLTGVPADRAELEILIDTMGRVNFAHYMPDRKGITQRVEYGGISLMDWQVTCLPFDAAMLAALRWVPMSAEAASTPALYRGSFSLGQRGDSFLDMRHWGRGAVWVNGHHLGRFWHIGPQQTLYLPGPWTRVGRNEIVVLDMAPRGARSVAGIDEPILDQLQAVAKPT